MTDDIKLKVGDRVWCPEDRGEAGYGGKVTYVSGLDCYSTVLKKKFYWVEVQRYPGITKHMWPSHRLSTNF